MSFAQSIAQRGAPSGSAGLLYGGPLVAGVEVSVLLSEQHTLSATATRTALEDGASVTDHVILDPVQISVAFAMSNAGTGSDQARDVYESFKKLRDEREVLELITEHALYENMVIVGIDHTHQAPHRGALQVTLRLQQLTFVEIQTVGRSPSVLSKEVEKQGSKEINAGTQNAPPANNSLIKRIGDIGRK